MKLSVCIPIYNVAAYVERCARSLFEQTYPDIEYLFVDDGTPDDSMDIVRRVLDDYPDRRRQVRLLRHERNLGLIAARKTAIRAATGELITHCDSDDWVDGDLYGKMIARMQDRDADAVLCSSRRFVGNRVVVARCPDDLVLSGEEAMKRMDELPALNAMMTKILRRDRIILDDVEYPEDLSIAEDYCFTMQVLPNCRRMATISDAFYNYRINPRSMTRGRNIRRLVDHHRRVFEILSQKVPASLSSVALRNLARVILYWGTAYGLLSGSEQVRWRQIYLSKGGRYDFSDMSVWGRRIMKLAWHSPALARCLAICSKGRLDDYL